VRVSLRHMTQTSRGRRGPRPRLLLGILLLAWGTSGCEEASSSGQTENIVNAWRQLGLMPSVFSSLDGENLKPGRCQQGKVDGVTVVLCEYADAAAAHAAHTAGLDRVGEDTGLALAGSKYLLIVSDPDKADPSGRKINAIAEASVRSWCRENRRARRTSARAKPPSPRARNHEPPERCSGCFADAALISWPP
jgi:hypothetical protein